MSETIAMAVRRIANETGNAELLVVAARLEGGATGKDQMPPDTSLDEGTPPPTQPGPGLGGGGGEDDGGG